MTSPRHHDAQDVHERPLRPDPLHEEAPAERRDHRHDREDEQDDVRAGAAQADRLDGEHGHDHDDRVDGVGVEEACDEESAQAGHLARIADRLPELRPRPDRVGHLEPVIVRLLFADDEEDRRGEQGEQHGRHEERERLRAGPGQQDEDRDEDRAEVARGDADAAHPAARVGLRDDRQRRVVVDECRLVREVGDREEGQAEERERVAALGDERDGGRRDDAQAGEEQQERKAPTAPIRDRPEDRRDDGVEPH